MKDIILFGIQGSGKGTQARLLCERHGYVTYSTGLALREHIAQGSDLGRRAQDYVSSGQLIPDDMLMELLEDFFRGIDQTKPVIFDGVPRTDVQVRGFDTIISEHRRACVAVLITLSEEEAIRRIRKRGESEGRSDDLDEQVIRTRFQNFREKTLPIVATFQERGTLLTVDGERDVETVHRDLVAALRSSGAITTIDQPPS